MVRGDGRLWVWAADEPQPLRPAPHTLVLMEPKARPSIPSRLVRRLAGSLSP